MITGVDTRKARAKLRAIIRESPRARLSGVKQAAGMVMARTLATSPRDTNRYVRAWAQAGNAAGVGRFIVPALNRASRFEQIEKRLRDEIGWWSYIVDRYIRQNRRDRWYNQAVRRLDRAKQEYQRLFQAEGGSVIGINTFSAIGSRRAPRAIYKVYGGTGVIDHSDHATFVRLHNLEAHASLVERRTGTLRKAASAFRGSGLAVVRGKYIEGIKAAVEAVAAR